VKGRLFGFAMLGLLVIILAVVPLSACAPSAPAGPAKTYSFNYNNVLAPGSWSEEWAKKYATEINKATKGAVTINVYMGAALGKPQDAVNLLNTGVADIVYHAGAFTPGVFPISDTSSLPFLITDPFKVLDFQNQMLADSKLNKEFADFKVLAFLPTNPTNLYMRNKEVKTVADIKGTKIRGAGGIYSQTVEALGATPVSIATTEVYSSLDKGVADGLTTNSSFLTQIKGWEVLKYGIKDGVNGGTHMMLMSKKAWSSLTPDLQKIIDDYNKQYAKDYTAYTAKDDTDAFAVLAGKGMALSTLSPAELANWKKLCAPLVDKWVADSTAKGLPASDAIALAKKIAG
jgi:TRAP-type C4-dicarboxylate transport system substrate-binding protein